MVVKLKIGMHDSERRTKRWFDGSSMIAFARRRFSASIMEDVPHVTIWLGMFLPWKAEEGGGGGVSVKEEGGWWM